MTDQVEVILQRAVTLFQQGDFDGAQRVCADALQSFPGHPEAEHINALALSGQGRTDEALSAFKRAAAVHPQRHAVLSNMGNALRKAGRLPEAIEAYESAIKANPGFLDGWYNFGVTLKQVGEAERASSAFQKALEINPNHPAALNNLGVLLADADQYGEAVEVFDKALAAKPDMVSALVNRGAAYRVLGRLNEALDDLRRVAMIAPQLGEVHYQLGNALRQAGNAPEAEAAYQRCLALEPFREDAHSDYAKMLWEHGQSDRFLSALNRTLEQRPSGSLYILKGELAFRAGDTATASAAAEAALRLDPRAFKAHRLISRIYRAGGGLIDAVGAALKAHEIAPGDFETLHDYAESLLLAGRYDEAATALQSDAPPDHLQKHIGLRALALRASGDPSYKQFYDYDRFTAKLKIKTPEGFDSLEAFNAALYEAIQPLHGTEQQPLDQTLYGGTQSGGRLWDEPDSIFQMLKAAMLEAAGRYIDALPDDPDHPFLRRKSTDLVCAGSWSVMLASGGGHVDHIHPKGWISASYYVRIPPELNKSERAGCLRLGASGVAGLDLPAERWIEPEAGAAIFFPSYMWHGVERFEASSPRVTAPIDLAPRHSALR